MLAATVRTQGGPGPASAPQVCVRAGESAPPGRPATHSGSHALCALPGGRPAAPTRGPAPAPGWGPEPARLSPAMSGGPEPRPCGGDAARDPAGLWLELGPACPGAPRCPSESSGPTSGDLGTSSGSSSTGLSPGSDSDSSGVVCGGRAAGMRGAPSRSRSLESLRSASAGKGSACSPAPSGLAAASPRPSPDPRLPHGFAPCRLLLMAAQPPVPSLTSF
ncbi:hypothetical protein NN561_016222 [Cricetulus griseus]